MRKSLLAVLIAFAASCSRSPSRDAGGAGAPASDTGVPAVREAKDLLADGKVVAGYAVYQKEIAPQSGKALEAFQAVAKQAGGDSKKLAQLAKTDARLVEFNKLNDAALARAGVSQGDVQTVSSALSEYLAEVYVAKGATDEAAQVKAADDKLQARYGPAALATVKKNLDALLAAQDAVLGAAMK